MKREHRLRTRADFRRVHDLSPRPWLHPLLLVRLAPNDLSHARVGITVSSRVGKAVVRNRIRRRLAEALRARFETLPPSLDVLVVARPPAARATWSELCSALDTVLRRAGATRPAAVSV